MGSAVALCGSATSGRGLTSVQVAAALRATVTAQLQRHAQRQGQHAAHVDGARAAAAVTTMQDGGGKNSSSNNNNSTRSDATLLRRTFSGVVEGCHSLDASCYSEEVTYDVVVDAPSPRTSAAATAAAAATPVVATTTTRSRSSVVRVTEYAPRVFYFLRQLCCVDEEVFADEWTLSREQMQLSMGEGRSQALFIKSRRMLFMCKTIAVDEVRVLLRILRDYVEHVSTHVNSLLMRFYMLLRLDILDDGGGRGRGRGEPSYLLCSADVYSGARKLNEKWDIKGRVPKPGKYRFFTRPQPPPPPPPQPLATGASPASSSSWPLLHRRRRRYKHTSSRNYYDEDSDDDDDDDDDVALRQPELVVTPVDAERRVTAGVRNGTTTTTTTTTTSAVARNRAASPSPLPPSQQQQQQQEGNASTRAGAATMSATSITTTTMTTTVVRRTIPTRHDKDLTRLFWLDKPMRDRLVTQLMADYAFLCRVHLMDYSLLVGVSYNNTKLSRSGHPYVLLYNLDSTDEVNAAAAGAAAGGVASSSSGSGGGGVAAAASSSAAAHTTSSTRQQSTQRRDGSDDARVASSSSNSNRAIADAARGGDVDNNNNNGDDDDEAHMVVLEELRPEVSYRLLPHAGTARHQLLSEFAEGVHSLHDQEVYYIGVIDILTKYNMKKKTANFCKSFLWEEQTLSTVPPALYRKRIARYTKIIFPDVT